MWGLQANKCYTSVLLSITIPKAVSQSHESIKKHKQHVLQRVAVIDRIMFRHDDEIQKYQDVCNGNVHLRMLPTPIAHITVWQIRREASWIFITSTAGQYDTLTDRDVVATYYPVLCSLCSLKAWVIQVLLPWNIQHSSANACETRIGIRIRVTIAYVVDRRYQPHTRVIRWMFFTIFEVTSTYHCTFPYMRRCMSSGDKRQCWRSHMRGLHVAGLNV